MGKLCLRISFVAILGLCVCGCQWVQQVLDSIESDQGGEKAAAAAQTAMYEDGIPRIRKGVGLIAQVSVVGEPPHTFEMQADENGDVMPPYLLTEPVNCEKMTLDEFRQELMKRYRKYIKQPQISVRFAPVPPGGVSPYGSVNVLGYVNNPGPVNIPATMDLTVTKALKDAGGFRQFANHHKVQVTQREKDGSLTKRMVDVIAIGTDGEEDILLKAGNVIYAHETYW